MKVPDRSVLAFSPKGLNPTGAENPEYRLGGGGGRHEWKREDQKEEREIDRRRTWRISLGKEATVSRL